MDALYISIVSLLLSFVYFSYRKSDSHFYNDDGGSMIKDFGIGENKSLCPIHLNCFLIAFIVYIAFKYIDLFYIE